ncbi:MAG: cysteine desulfurase family protein [Bacteroidota bacterium]
MKVYLDNAASAPMDPEVFEHMKPFFFEMYGNPSSTHAHGRALKNIIEQARRTIATNLNARPGEIIFTSGGTEADNMAITGAVEGMGIKHIISSPIEHHAVTHTIEHLEAQGRVTVSWLSVDGKGHIDLAELTELLKAHQHCLVSLMHANNEIGTLHDIQAIGELCREHGALFHSDTVQTMGGFRFDMETLPVDLATASAHKFYGPKGVGFLYVRKGINLPPLIHGGSQERSMRAGTENLASIAGMAFAYDKCQKMHDHKSQLLWDLKTYMQEQLREAIPGVSFNGDTSREKSIPTVLNTSFPGEAEDSLLLFHLDIQGISVSGGSACNSGANLGSHVLRTIGLTGAPLVQAVRFSFGPQNTREELDFVIGKLKEIVPASVM